MKITVISVVLAIVLIGGAFMLSNKNKTEIPVVNANNVSIVDGKQIIDLTAKGGYQPRKSIAQAGLPTILRVNTSGTFDCSASISIPNKKISKILPQTGITDIDLGVSVLGTLQGTCGMGMYPFEIEFKA